MDSLGQIWSWDYAFRALWRHMRGQKRHPDVVADLKNGAVEDQGDE